MASSAGIKAFTAAVLGASARCRAPWLGRLFDRSDRPVVGVFFGRIQGRRGVLDLIIVLIFLPTGLLGRPEVEKV